MASLSTAPTGTSPNPPSKASITAVWSTNPSAPSTISALGSTRSFTSPKRSSIRRGSASLPIGSTARKTSSPNSSTASMLAVAVFPNSSPPAAKPASIPFPTGQEALRAKIVFVLHRFVLHNDRICEASEPGLSPGQVGLLSGWGVFTTVRVADGVLFAFDRHWARISRDAAALHVPLPTGPENVQSQLLELVEANNARNATLRLVIVRNTGGMWTGPSTGRPADIIGLTAASKEWGAAVKLAYVADGRHAASPFSGTKILSWAFNLTW